MRRSFPHLAALAIFISIAVIYCRPVFQGKVLDQDDVSGWLGMVHQMQQYKAAHGHFPLWNNSMFGGMPAYQIALEPETGLSLSFLHPLLTLFLPTPASFFFLLCLSFYFLTQVLRIKPWIGIMGALAYAYASWSPILISAGHETQLQAMGYVPFVLGSLILLYEGKYLWGALLTGIFSGLLISRNHPQITYYSLIIVLAVTLFYIVRWVREKRWRHAALALGLAAVTGTLGAMTNATTLLTTYEYAKESARGGSVVGAKSGLPEDYAFQWSYGRAETYSLLVPDVYGGASQTLGDHSRLKAELDRDRLPSWEADQFYTAFNAYWGDQPDTSGPVYLGAILCFLFLLSAFYSQSPHKWWILPLTVVAILMAWGRHFAIFNDFLFTHLPLFNKFRAPSMILFIPQLTVPLLVCLGLQDARVYRPRPVLWALGGTAVLFLGALTLYLTMDYRNDQDRQRAQYLTQINKLQPAVGEQLLQAASEDRKALFGDDLLRSLAFVMGGAGLLLAFRRKPAYALAGLGVLAFVDLMGVDTRYLNQHSYMNREETGSNMTPTDADEQISRDTSYYRVLNLTQGLSGAFQESVTSYFHNSLGGYHPAKLALIEDLISRQLTRQPLNQAVLDMLNTKYLIMPHLLSPVTFDESSTPDEHPIVVENREALGPCWFVERLHLAADAGEVMSDLDHFNPGDSALVEQNIPQPSHSTRGWIRLVKNDNDVITYSSYSPTNEFAVFSEIYYAQGWKAYVDGTPIPIVKADYALRGLSLSPGQHTLRFEFRPDSYYLGQKIASVSTWLMWMLLLGTLAREVVRRRSF